MQKKLQSFLVWIICYSIHSPTQLFGQNNSYIIENVSTLQGLSSNLVVDADWDNNGFLWISTENAMNRFDGFNVMKYVEKSTKIKYYSYFSPLIKNKNAFEYSDIHGEIFRIGNQQEPIKLSQIDSSSRNKSFDMDCNFTLSFPFHVSKHVDSMFSYLSYNEEPILFKNKLFFIVHDSLFKFDDNQISPKFMKAFKGGSKLIRIGDKCFVFSEQHHMFYQFEDQQYAALSILLNKVVPPIKIQKVFWLNNIDYAIGVSKDSIYKLDLDKKTFLKLTAIAPLKIALKKISSIKYNEKVHTTVVSTMGEGVYIIKKTPLKLVPERQQQGDIILPRRTFVETYNGICWGNNSSEFDINGNFFITKSEIVLFKSAVKLNDTTLFLHLLNDSIATYYLNSKKISSNSIIRNSESHASSFIQVGQRVLNISSKGILEMTSTLDTFIYRFDYHLGDIFGRAVCKLDSTNIIMGGTDGIYIFNLATLKNKHIKSSSSLNIISLTQHKNLTFISTIGQGLWIMNQNDQLFHVSNDKYDYMTYTLSTRIESENNIWIATNSALIHTTLNEVMRNIQPLEASNETRGLNATIFDKTSGLELIEFYGGCQGCNQRLSNGKLCYTGLMGFLEVDTKQFDVERNSKLFIFTQLNSTKIDITADSKLIQKLNQDDTIQFTVFCPTWTNTNGKLIKYRLSNKTTKWSNLDLTKSNRITLNNLSADEYELEIMNNQPDDIVKIKFIVQAPWFLRWWAKLFWLLLGIILIYFLVHLRTKFLKKENQKLTDNLDIQAKEIIQKNKELEERMVIMQDYQEQLEKDYALKNRLISTIGHDFIIPLDFMNKSGRTLMNYREEIDSNTYKQTFKTILKTGQSLQSMAENMVIFIKHFHQKLRFEQSFFDITNLILILIETVKPMADLKGIKILFDSPTIKINQYEEPVKILLYQLLVNAIKYTDEGFIKINIVRSEMELNIFVEDSGLGISPEMIDNIVNPNYTQQSLYLQNNILGGLGYQIIHDMLNILGGKIQISSARMKGSIIAIEFSIN